MACRRCSQLLASLILVLHRCRRRQGKNKKQKQGFWVRKIINEERKERNEWENLFCELSNDDLELSNDELSNDDLEYYYRYLRMRPERFEHLFNFVGPLIAKQDTHVIAKKATHATRKNTISNVFLNVLQLSHSISLTANYRQKLARENSHFFIITRYYKLSLFHNTMILYRLENWR